MELALHGDGNGLCTLHYETYGRTKIAWNSIEMYHTGQTTGGNAYTYILRSEGDCLESAARIVCDLCQIMLAERLSRSADRCQAYHV